MVGNVELNVSTTAHIKYFVWEVSSVTSTWACQSKKAVIDCGLIICFPVVASRKHPFAWATKAKRKKKWDTGSLDRSWPPLPRHAKIAYAASWKSWSGAFFAPSSFESSPPVPSVGHPARSVLQQSPKERSKKTGLGVAFVIQGVDSPGWMSVSIL